MPLVYLPGISRQRLRAVESTPRPLQPLAELQHRGALWSQVNGRDWTLLAFLTTGDGGLGLDVARDTATSEAMQRALLELADVPLADLEGKRLEASDFDVLLTPDPVRDILLWLDDPEGTRARCPASKWSSFCTVCRERFEFHPEQDDEIIAAGKLGRRKGDWMKVWRRYAEAPRRYPHLPDRLRQARPPEGPDLFGGEETWPQDNEVMEDQLRAALLALRDELPQKAAERIAQLEDVHGKRRGWVWAELGQARLAGALRHLFELARATRQPLGGVSPEACADAYRRHGWQADDALLRVLASVSDYADEQAVQAAAVAVYKPWLERTTESFLQSLAGHETPQPTINSPVPPQAGRVVLFVDALRFDVGQRLCEMLTETGCVVEEGWRWVPLPSVTPTSKPILSPVASELSQTSTSSEFRPQLTDGAKDLTVARFRSRLEKGGYQFLSHEETGDPSGSAWTEIGTLDSYGHQQGWKLARRIDELVRDAASRVGRLLDAGWQEVRIVTDHGWLLLPGGLPKADLPHFLTDNRWGRCAVMKRGAKTDLPTFGWFWNPDVRIAIPHGVHVFRKGLEYAHGGLSLQECVVPTFTVTHVGSGRQRG